MCYVVLWKDLILPILLHKLDKSYILNISKFLPFFVRHYRQILRSFSKLKRPIIYAVDKQERKCVINYGQIIIFTGLR